MGDGGANRSSISLVQAISKGSPLCHFLDILYIVAIVRTYIVIAMRVYMSGLHLNVLWHKYQIGLFGWVYKWLNHELESHNW